MTGYTFNQLFDFTRTTAATFVGSNGLIQTTPASVNLLTFTQEFDNAAWVKAGATVSANTTIAPDGTATADKMVETATTAPHAVYQVFTYGAGLVYAATVYAKKAERNWIYVGADTAAAEAVFFDLDTGTVGSQGTGYVGSITNAGDGWYRCTVITTQSTALPPNFLVVGLASANGTPSYAGNGTSGAFIWGAQLELGNTATTYARNNGGVFPPRFDYDPVTLAPRGILIEEQRTNLFLYSQEFDNAYWVKLGGAITANAATAPDGTLSADRLTEDTSTGLHITYRPVSVTSGTAYTMSFWAKRGTGSRDLYIRMDNGTTTLRSFVNLGTGAVTPASGHTVTARTWGAYWYVTCVVTATATTSVVMGAEMAVIGTGPSYTGDGISSIDLYGAQVEVGSFATSYIPTVASQVTRSADVCTISAPMFAPWYRQSEGTWVAAVSATAGSARALTASAGALTNQLWLQGGAAAEAAFQVYTAGAFVAQLALLGSTASKTIAGAYNVNDFAATIDGGTVATDTSGTIGTFDRLNIGTRFDGTAGFLNGHIRRITYYPFRASNNQLQALTT